MCSLHSIALLPRRRWCVKSMSQWHCSGRIKVICNLHVVHYRRALLVTPMPCCVLNGMRQLPFCSIIVVPFFTKCTATQTPAWMLITHFSTTHTTLRRYNDVVDHCNNWDLLNWGNTMYRHQYLRIPFTCATLDR